MRKFVGTFLQIDDFDVPVSGIVVVNDEGDIMEVDIAGITRADLPDACDIEVEDNDGNIYNTWGIPE